MSRWWTPILLLCSSVLSSRTVASATQNELVLTPKPASIVGVDPRFGQLVPKDAKVEKIAGGFRWVEGPVWNKKEQALLFSDIPANRVYRWKEGEGIKPFLRPSGYSGAVPFTGKEPGSNGLIFDANRQLVLCQHDDRRIARLEADGTFTTLADRYNAHRLNSPNDLVFNFKR